MKLGILIYGLAGILSGCCLLSARDPYEATTNEARSCVKQCQAEPTLCHGLFACSHLLLFGVGYKPSNTETNACAACCSSAENYCIAACPDMKIRSSFGIPAPKSDAVRCSYRCRSDREACYADCYISQPGSGCFGKCDQTLAGCQQGCGSLPP